MKSSNEIFECILLLALPASGKSEIRKYLASLSPDECKKIFHIGKTVQLDDFPYVHFMRRIDEELSSLEKKRLFFHSPEEPFINPWDWGTLIHLLNEDYDDLISNKVLDLNNSALLLFERIDSAASKAGIPHRLSALENDIKKTIATKLEYEARKIFEEKIKNYTDTFEGKTIVIEFARGGADGASMPLVPPFGYEYSLSILDSRILEKASILYVWVTPEESRRKNEERANPADPGSILHHGVPIKVMLNDYGCDDINWLEEKSDIHGTIKIKAHGCYWNIPISRFDNRIDKTSFLRNDAKTWKEEDIYALRNELVNALDKLWRVKTSNKNIL